MSLKKAAGTVPKLVFNNGRQIPIIGLGTWNVRIDRFFYHIPALN